LKLPNFAYFEGKIVPYTEARVGVLTHAFNYGTAVIAGLRGYWNPDKNTLFIFRPIDHFRRFIQSSRLLCMDLDHTPESLLEVTLQLLQKENYREDIYIRPLAYKADEVIGVRLHNLRDAVTIVALPFERYVPNDTNAHLTISSWRRVDDNSIPARGKVSGAYVNSSLVKTEAQHAGYDEALVLNHDGHVSEGSAENVFIVREGVLITPPVTDNILEGITRRSVIQLARDELGLQVLERSIDRTELYVCDELFLTGTAAQITIATRIDHRPIGNGMAGPVSTRLRHLYDDVLRGRNLDYSHWIVPVKPGEQ
jgi:branched-chain amino acid aminotransferase